ncbi:MAG: hypothetical protein ACRDIY_09275 [Chloroflexota bacterium]
MDKREFDSVDILTGVDGYWGCGDAQIVTMPSPEEDRVMARHVIYR